MDHSDSTDHQSLTTISGWAMALVRALESYSIEPAPLLKQSGIETSLLQDSAQRIPVTQMTTLWQLAREKTGDEAFGLKVANCVSPSSFHTLGYAIMASDSITDIIEKASKNVRVISEIGRLVLDNKGDEYQLTLNLTHEEPVVTFECIDAFMGSIICFSKNYLQFSPKLCKVAMKRPQPNNPKHWESFFSAPVLFNQPSNTLYLNHVPTPELPSANPTLAAASEQLTADYLKSLDHTTTPTTTISHRVAQLIEENLLTGENSLEKVAKQMCLSERHLQRQLKEENNSYQQILDTQRESLARRWLQSNTYSQVEIAERLGFNTQSSFSRAFKRWTGKPPSDFLKSNNKP